LFLTHCLLFSVNRVAVEHYLNYLMPRFRAPQQSRGRLQASFGGAQSAPANKKIGRKCDLATAFTTQRRYKSNKRRYRLPRECGVCKRYFCGASEGEGYNNAACEGCSPIIWGT
jgi:hypothetical protein